MRAQVTCQPDQTSTNNLLAQEGDERVCVRSRFDEGRERRLKTGEVVVEEAPWRSPGAARKGAVMVGARVG